MTERAREASGAAPLDITTPEWKADPFPLYARLREERPVCRVTVNGVGGWMVTRYDDVLAALKDARLVKNGRSVRAGPPVKYPWIPKPLRSLGLNMLDQDDPRHARQRGLVHKAFTPGRIAQMEATIRATAGRLLDAAARRRSMDLIRGFARPLPLTVIIELLGVPPADHRAIHGWSTAVLRPRTPLNMLRALPGTLRFMRHLRRLFAERRARPRDDLLTALALAEDSGDRLSDDELVAMVILLLLAGHETTVNLIASGALALLQHPEQLALLRAEPALMPAAIEELLRFTNPVETATDRFAREEIAIAGVTIEPGSLVLASIASANRDPRHFADPERLDLARSPNRHLAFGHGAHFCLGAPLARLEGRIALGALLERLPDLRLAAPAERLRWRATPVVRGLAALPVAWGPR